MQLRCSTATSPPTLGGVDTAPVSIENDFDNIEFRGDRLSFDTVFLTRWVTPRWQKTTCDVVHKVTLTNIVLYPLCELPMSLAMRNSCCVTSQVAMLRCCEPLILFWLVQSHVMFLPKKGPLLPTTLCCIGLVLYSWLYLVFYRQWGRYAFCLRFR